MYPARREVATQRSIRKNERETAPVSDRVQSAIKGVIAAVLAALIAFGVLGGDSADAVQGVALAVLALVSVVGVRSALPPKK